MKVKKVKKILDKKLITFKNGLQVLVPYRYEIEPDMKLKLQYDGVMLDLNEEFVNIFTLYNKEESFNLYINDNSQYKDIRNLNSLFVNYGNVNMDEIFEEYKKYM